MQYLIHPIQVLGEIARVLKPGSVCAVSFSNRCFPTKAIRMWLQTDDLEHCMIAASYLHYAGFTDIQGFDITTGTDVGAGSMGGERRRDPMFVIQATKLPRPLDGGKPSPSDDAIQHHAGL